MILSDRKIKALLEGGELIINPIGDQSIQPASVDARLGNSFLVVEQNQTEILTLDSEIKYREIESECIVIPSHSFVLATTLEYIKLPNNVTA